MNKNKLGLKTAFPLDGHYAGDALKSNNQGMSKRFYAASKYTDSAYKWAEEMSIQVCKEILGLGKDDNWIYKKHFPILVVKLQYILADELLKQEM